MFLASVNALLQKPQMLRQWLRPATAAGLLCASVFGAPLAWSTPAEVDQVNQLLSSGKVNEASRVVQEALRKNRNDVQMRFLQGVVAVEQQKYEQAIDLFNALAKDYPNLPEPYNNLAVLYAAKGDDRKAAQALEQAIRTNPSYATAHQNLGDLYARMANDAYAKALQLDSSRKPVQPKLTALNQITPSHRTATDTPITVAAAPKPSTLPAAAPAPAPEPAAPVSAAASVATAPAAGPAPAPAAVEPPSMAIHAPAVNTGTSSKLASAASERVAAAAPAAPAAPAVTAAASTPAPKVTPPVNAHAQAVAAVEKAVAAWARAWEQQNMANYYAAYSPRFKPANGSSLDNWKAERKARIVDKPTISVDVRDLKVSVNGDRATASFRQAYASGSLKTTTRKTLQMQYEGDKWRITREETGR